MTSVAMGIRVSLRTDIRSAIVIAIVAASHIGRVMAAIAGMTVMSGLAIPPYEARTVMPAMEMFMATNRTVSSLRNLPRG